MKAFLILTALLIVGLVVVSVTMASSDPTGISVVVGWAYMIVAYVIALVCVGFWRSYQRFQDSRQDTPKMDHPRHRIGLVRSNQLPDWMRDDHPNA